MEWFGWFWTGSQWRRVTGPHATLGECAHTLSAIGRARGVADKFQVMTGGAMPTFRPADKRSAPEPSRPSASMWEEP